MIVTPRARLADTDRALLLDLLRTPTAGPLETGSAGPAPLLWRAQRAYAAAAAALGFTAVHHACAEPADLDAEDVPATVRAAAADPRFLACQPSLVLRLGRPRAHRATVMFNVHLDTVAGLEDVGFDGTRFTGRGAIDAKGPAVALLAGIRAALAARPDLPEQISVLIQAVAGEEGGVLGTLGTRRLVRRGFHGRLNVFCEPTGLRYLTRATAAMTARVRVEGRDAVDDRPGHGHNASVLLGFLAQHLAAELAPHAAGGACCVAGLHTGTLHNRVYGTGDLLLNLSYADAAEGHALDGALGAALRSGLDAFRARFAAHPAFALTAAEAASITRLHWEKRGLPALSGGDPWLEALLGERVGLTAWPADEPAFTCDAIWLAGVPDTATVVFGPGALDTNHAHARDEFADAAELDAFADRIARLLLGFAAECGEPHDPAAGTRSPHQRGLAAHRVRAGRVDSTSAADAGAGTGGGKPAAVPVRRGCAAP